MEFLKATFLGPIARGKLRVTKEKEKRTGSVLLRRFRDKHNNHGVCS